MLPNITIQQADPLAQMSQGVASFNAAPAGKETVAAKQAAD